MQNAHLGKNIRLEIGSSSFELFFSQTFFVTNFSKSFSPQVIVQSYRKRGTMENFMKEAKNGFGFDHLLFRI